MLDETRIKRYRMTDSTGVDHVVRSYSRPEGGWYGLLDDDQRTRDPFDTEEEALGRVRTCLEEEGPARRFIVRIVPLETQRPEDALETLRAGIRELIEVAWVPVDQTIGCPGCGAVWWLSREELHENWHAEDCPVFKWCLASGYRWGTKELATVNVRRDPAPEARGLWEMRSEADCILQHRRDVDAKVAAETQRCLAAFDAGWEDAAAMDEPGPLRRALAGAP